VLGKRLVKRCEISDWGWYQAAQAAHRCWRAGGKVFVSVKNNDKPRAIEVARALALMGFAVVATKARPRP